MILDAMKKAGSIFIGSIKLHKELWSALQARYITDDAGTDLILLTSSLNSRWLIINQSWNIFKRLFECVKISLRMENQ